eukprot:CAMPEP_0195088906 /NCGR_PEP_ID=MMETSP0448-20130528/28347_1 /TAXON_ID=66468 /ORGANISM="Heterocapsa triquestra, Strain CCMP 448" /LENGTH=52 /DNA_ID=CAMNT_0040122603 /DNA_START=8 /DNA_END=163 /DNA_ORIENTATION=+
MRPRSPVLTSPAGRTSRRGIVVGQNPTEGRIKKHLCPAAAVSDSDRTQGARG